MKKVQKIFQKKILPNKSMSHQNLSSPNHVDVPNNEISKRQVFQRYKKAWYAEINNQYESSDSSGSDIDDETGYIRMKRNSKLQHLRQSSLNSSNIFEYSTRENSYLDTQQACQSSENIVPERDKSSDFKSYFMKAAFDFLSYDISDKTKEVTVSDGEIVKIIDFSNKKKFLVENIDGCQINMPKCYLMDLTKEELYEILSEDFVEENISDSKKIVSTNLKSQKNKSNSASAEKFDRYLEKRAEAPKSILKKPQAQKTPANEYVIKNLSSLTKYRSLTDSLDKDAVLEQEDEEKFFQYKINPITQRKTKPKGPLLFNEEIWVDGENVNNIAPNKNMESCEKKL